MLICTLIKSRLWIWVIYFEELIRKFSESYDEQAGAHFTSRDIIYLMAELLVANEKEHIKQNGVVKTAYDMAMGTSQMLGCLDEKNATNQPGFKVISIWSRI